MADSQDSQVIVTITGVGVQQQVDASGAATLADVLRGAGIDPDAVQAKVNGGVASSDESLSNGDQVTATPRDTKLG